MFEEQKSVVDAVLVAEFDQALLQGEAFGIGDAAELEEV
jgi:hypothetical protein